RSILGMDDGAFRASVFAEQKQIASFSGQTPAERRKLVLQLLGITPVDTAKDQARKDGRMAMEQYTRARDLLPDVEKAKAEVADAAEALTKLEPDATGLADAERRLAAVQVVDRARAALEQLPSVEEPPRPDEQACDAARADAERVGRELAEIDGRMKGAVDEL